MGRDLSSKHSEIHRGQYTYRLLIGKATGDGEQSSLEIIANEDELARCSQLGYQILDARMYQQNQRYLASMQILDELPVDLRMQVLRCIETAFGRVPIEDRLPPVDQMLRRVEKEPESGEGQG